MVSMYGDILYITDKNNNVICCFTNKQKIRQDLQIAEYIYKNKLIIPDFNAPVAISNKLQVALKEYHHKYRQWEK